MTASPSTRARDTVVRMPQDTAPLSPPTAEAPPMTPPDLEPPPPASPFEAPPLIVVPSAAPRTRGRPRKRPDPASGPSAPPPPFVGGPPRNDDAAGASGPQAELRKVLADPEKASKMLVGVVDGLLTLLAKSRYGNLVGPNGVPLVELMAVTSKERDELTDAVCLFLKASSMSISPGANMAIAFGATYGVRAMGLESTRAALKKQARGGAPQA